MGGAKPLINILQIDGGQMMTKINVFCVGVGEGKSVPTSPWGQFPRSCE